MGMRILVLTDDPAVDTNLRENLEEVADGGDLEVKVIAPLRPESTIDLVTGDLADAKEAAQERADDAVAESARAEAVTSAAGEVGDADQLLAIGDALAEFEAEQIVLVDPIDDELAAAARERYGLPVTELTAG